MIQIIDTDDTVTFLKLEGEPTLEQIQGWVRGYIEFAPVGGVEMQAVANEEGRINGMGYNMRASRMFNMDLFGPIVILTNGNQLT